ncbi:sensor histidine kinase [Arsukibacterium sp.]|uniref:sensor histidine kinase n=1 Tax=Arsukibacterium sp. TaxID=1977258 RepID=UPI002FDB5F0D
MAALGQVVAGIAHEINTPLGISVTAGSLLMENTEAVQQKFEKKTLTGSQMQQYLQQSLEQLQLLNSNLQRSADLVQSFKEIAVENRNNALETVNIKRWLEQRIRLFGQALYMHQVNLSCPADLQLHFATSALETVLFQLLHNSLLHGFTEQSRGQIDISLSYADQQCILDYRDNGRGVAAQMSQHIFEPFVTSKRGSNCKGLGLHLCYNLMTQVLGGSIELLENAPTGALFRLTFPVSDNTPGRTEVV